MSGSEQRGATLPTVSGSTDVALQYNLFANLVQSYATETPEGDEDGLIAALSEDSVL